MEEHTKDGGGVEKKSRVLLILAVSDVRLTWSCSLNQLSIMSSSLARSREREREWNNTDVLLYIFLPRSIRLSWRTFLTLMYRLEKTATLIVGSCHPFLKYSCFLFLVKKVSEF